MSTITSILGTDLPKDSRAVINTNFSNLNTDKMEKSGGTFTGDISVPAEVYGAGWNGSNEVPTKNDLYDKIQTISGGDVVGPASSTDNALARMDGTTGKLLQNGAITESDAGSLGNVNSIILDTSYTGTPVEAEMYWDSTEKTVSIKTGLDTSTLQIGREEHIFVRNNTGSTILNGKAVYITGSSTNPTIALAQANDYTKSSKTIGIATMDIPNSTDGLVTILGLVHDLNTSGFTAGDILYLDNSTAGGIINTNPTGINYSLEVGMCIVSHATTGIIFVTPKSLKAFPSDEFKVTDATDKTKQITFGVSGVTTGTKRTLTVPNADTTLIGTTTPDTLTNKSISLGTNTVTSTFAQLNTAVTDADLARTDAANTFTGTQTITQIDMGNTDTSITRVSAGKIAVEGVNVGNEGILQNSQSAAYTTVLLDAGKHIYHPGTDTTARTWTIDSNANVAYSIGTAITFINDTSAGTLTIAITSDTMILAGAGTTGSRTLTANGIATAVKITSTRWIINGTNLT